MGSVHGKEHSNTIALRIYRHLVEICQREQYSGQHEPMNVQLKNELDFRSRSHFTLMSFETFRSWADDDEVPTKHEPHWIRTFDFNGIVRLHMHWRNERFSKYANGREDVFECYTRRPHGDWTRTLSFVTADASAVKRGIPLLTKDNYATLVAESDPLAPVPLIYSELQRLIKTVADDRNYWISSANIPRVLEDVLELESHGLLWAKANHVVPQNINGEWHKLT